jgi:putative hydrolase
MQNLIDVHTHSVLSTHAYSTIWENVKIAKEKGLKYCGISDHAPAITGGQHIFAISNLRIIPEFIEGVRVLKGVELNILDTNGNYDVPLNLIKRLDYTIASFHVPVVKKMTIDETTSAYLNLCNDEYVTVLGHIDDERYKCDYEKVIKRCSETNTLIEINDSSLRTTTSRVNGINNVEEILIIAKKYKLPVIINSDSHICFDVGRIEEAMELIEKVDYPRNLLINFNEDLIKKYFLK